MPISPKTAKFLKSLGYECHHVSEFKMEKADDESIVKFAKSNGYTIITEDLDFGAILAYTKEMEPSIIIMRVGNLTTNQINQLMAKVLPTIMDMKNCIIVIERTKIRIKKLPIPSLRSKLK